MSITVELDEDTALDMLVERVKYWTNDEDELDLFEQMYDSYICGGCFDGGEFNVMRIVDNDYVNWCSIIYKEDTNKEDWEKLVKLFEDGDRDISSENFEDFSYSFVEAMNEERTMALMRS